MNRLAHVYSKHWSGGDGEAVGVEEAEEVSGGVAGVGCMVFGGKCCMHSVLQKSYCRDYRVELVQKSTCTVLSVYCKMYILTCRLSNVYRRTFSVETVL